MFVLSILCEVFFVCIGHTGYTWESFSFCETVSLYRAVWLETYSPPVSASLRQGLLDCISMSCIRQFQYWLCTPSYDLELLRYLIKLSSLPRLTEVPFFWVAGLSLGNHEGILSLSCTPDLQSHFLFTLGCLQRSHNVGKNHLKLQNSFQR